MPLRVLDVDEMGFMVKGHGLTAEAIRDALWAVAEAHGYDEGVSPADCHPRSEIWVRQRPSFAPDVYAYYVDVTEPHARGAGRFTFIDVTRSKGEQRRYARPW